MDYSIEFYRNPGQTLYDYIKFHYPGLRQAILSQQGVSEMLYWDNLQPEEKDLIRQYQGPLPEAENLFEQLTHEELTGLLWMTESYALGNKRATLEEEDIRMAFEKFLRFLEQQNHPMRLSMRHILHRPYTLQSENNQQANDALAPWGYWTSQECLKMLLFLRGLTQRDHPEYSVFETQIKIPKSLFTTTTNI